MSLSFREQAAIALFACIEGEITYNEMGARDAAQALAEACCARWGHDWAPWAHGNWRPPHMEIRDDEARCRRCGAKEST